jgi:hypothetical protein
MLNLRRCLMYYYSGLPVPDNNRKSFMHQRIHAILITLCRTLVVISRTIDHSFGVKNNVTVGGCAGYILLSVAVNDIIKISK